MIALEAKKDVCGLDVTKNYLSSVEIGEQRVGATPTAAGSLLAAPLLARGERDEGEGARRGSKERKQASERAEKRDEVRNRKEEQE